MRASRLVSLLLLLQTRGRMTAQELADALEVSVRTIYRDVESLSAAGVPVYGEPGHEGGYQLLDGYRTRLTGLSAAEAEAVFLTGLPAAATSLGLAAVASARLKLTAALPAELRDRASRIAERFHLDTPPWYQGAEHTPHLAAIADATWNQHAVRIRYLRWAQPHEITRTVQPHGLVLKGGHWYLVARGDGQFRTYRVSRVLDADVLTGRFDRAEGFDLASHWTSYLSRFDQCRHRDTAVVRLSRRGLDRLPHLLEPVMVDAARRTATEPDAAGWTRVAVPIESVDVAATELLKLGADAEVLAPDDLREQIIRTVHEMNRVYGGRPASPHPRADP
ncbi:helix-turn-helix transcriptional regulator [Goodfellowiella coeruleoviolacea]|uniref:DNA-binding transcriptional regulator YafY, contains an HTH and WYL domains n=1 Tax=Goodfellowiella coeruleoviolacea TaxID=334858 RepID=A0AAE3GKX8_9PSEU|nr:YafY family protein [Goodfellowiella coeruleoviolacea]MCP2170162.1 putative DNA-binding transcriptional regulator YafY, contains an HTH and WYL domains [Goodfellowiella coeruleoviolacea]